MEIDMCPINKIKSLKSFRYKLLRILFCFNKERRHRATEILVDKLCLSKQKHKFSQNFPDVYQTPVFVISFNQLSYVKQMVSWLKKYGFSNIHIVDNKSTYKPLLNYLKKVDCVVHNMDKNYGHTVVWTSGQFDDIITKQCYIVSDCDIAPNPNLPKDFMHNLYQILGQYPYITKVGFALNIHDLPNTDKNKTVKKWEDKFWKREIDKDLYYADIDTTFALYRPGKLAMDTKQFYSALRVAGNMTAIHLPWFETKETKETEFYKKTANISASWAKNLSMYKKRKK
ncbi:MAG: hypothetical protein IKM94_01690 [Alphaproteobacteria bacterium]|nr:hypothetical protein [Alphaproteobacteria bacterium]